MLRILKNHSIRNVSSKLMSLSMNQQQVKQYNKFYPEYSKYLSETATEGYIWKSQFGELNTENLNLKLQDFIWKDLNKWHNKTAMVCYSSGREYRYGKLRDCCAAFAIRLQNEKIRLNLRTTDVITICLPNIPEFAIALLGSIEAGLTVSPILYHTDIGNMVRQLNINDSSWMICTVDNYAKIKRACNIINKFIKIIVVKTNSYDRLPDGEMNFSDMINLNNIDFSQLNTLPMKPTKDVILMPFTAGTTDLPKCVQITHSNSVANCEASNLKIGTNSIIKETTDSHQDCIAPTIPFTHIDGLMSNLCSKLAVGCKIVTLDEFRYHAYFELLKQHKPSAVHLTPHVINEFRLINDNNLSRYFNSVRTFICSGDHLGKLDIENFKKMIPYAEILQGYGLTETCGLAFFNDFNMKKLGSIGFPLPGIEAKICTFDDPKNIGIGAYEYGELLLRGSGVTNWYVKNEKLTKSTFIGEWLRTGDIAFYDKDGSFYVNGRIGDMLDSKEHWLLPAQIESIIKTHPKVSDVAVINVPHAEKQKIARAYIVPRSEKKDPLTKEEITKFMYNYVGVDEVIDDIEFTTLICRSPLGKINRSTCK